MDRATADKINNDRQIVDLRMQVEDLINNSEHMDKEAYVAESKRIEDALAKRFDELYEEYK